MLWEFEQIKYHGEIRGEGQPVVCLHGFAENLHTWDSFQPAGCRLILMDWVGHGASDKPRDRRYYHWKTMIESLHRLIHDLGYDHYSLLGYSMGGRLALAYALTYAEEVDHLILESASYGEQGIIRRWQRRRRDLSLAGKIRKDGIRWFSQYWSGLPLFTTQRHLTESIRQAIEERRLANSPEALALTLQGSGQGTVPCLKNRVPELKMPVLYISGEQDRKYQKMGSEMEWLNPGISFQSIPGAGHNTHVERPQEFQRIVEAFLPI